MTAPERIHVPYVGEQPRACPTAVWDDHVEAKQSGKGRSWLWLLQARRHFARDRFLEFKHRPQPLEPRDDDARAQARYHAAVSANADRYLDLERFRCALEDHAHGSPEHQAVLAALDTYRGWGVPKVMRPWFESDHRSIVTRRPCRHGFMVEWAGDECPDGCG